MCTSTVARKEIMMFQIDVLSRTPVYEQLIGQLEKYLLSDILRPGDKLPSVRQLSTTLGVNPNTIAKAFTIMEQRGLTISVQGRGVFISQDAAELMRQKFRSKENEIRDITKELKLSGMGLREIIEVVTKAYEED